MTTVFQVSIWSQIMAHQIDDLFEEVYIILIKRGKAGIGLFSLSPQPSMGPSSSGSCHPHLKRKLPWRFDTKCPDKLSP